ncbi:hypothetical protein rosag_36440 [Roseisolibacter agri]|uniref:Uncharacterized protein n=1 Tax=Roseisolibacter agri TaxID=2014610 RepID=A0AA37V7V4_9BACT|nr:hypothetical protein rosag_36440 [Roseisolibacter agri]
MRREPFAGAAGAAGAAAGGSGAIGVGSSRRGDWAVAADMRISGRKAAAGADGDPDVGEGESGCGRVISRLMAAG